MGWAQDRSSRPHRCPRQTSADLERRVCGARERTGWGPRLIAGEVGLAHSTVHAVLRRHGCSRRPRPAAREVCRYEWPCPGDLLHMDVKRYPRFARPGHAVTGDRHKTSVEKRRPLGHDFFHAVVDDHSRLAYGELLADERAVTVTAFVERALDWFARRGITTRRLMTDGAWGYTRNRGLRELLSAQEVRHIVTPPYTPRWNGKVERFHQTMEREWAKGLRYRHSTARNQALPHWLAHYNERRPHSALGGRPPISRVHNLSGQEQLESWFAESPGKGYAGRNIGPPDMIVLRGGAPVDHFGHFDPQTATVTFWDRSVALDPVVKEAHRVLARLREIENRRWGPGAPMP